jgi:hypothetical protein
VGEVSVALVERGHDPRSELKVQRQGRAYRRPQLRSRWAVRRDGGRGSSVSRLREPHDGCRGTCGAWRATLERHGPRGDFEGSEMARVQKAVMEEVRGEGD